MENGLRPAARGLAGEIAKLMARPEKDGFTACRYFQEAKIFGVGAGGTAGCCSPRAGTSHGVLLLLAMASGSPPRESIRDALTVAMLPFIELRRYQVQRRAESYTVESGGADEPLGFGACLGQIIAGKRRGHSPDGSPASVRFGVNGNFRYGEIWLRVPRRVGDKGAPIRVLRFGASIESAPPGRYPLTRSIEVSGEILADIAGLLGASGTTDETTIAEPASAGFGRYGGDLQDEARALAAQIGRSAASFAANAIAN